MVVAAAVEAEAAVVKGFNVSVDCCAFILTKICLKAMIGGNKMYKALLGSVMLLSMTMFGCTTGIHGSFAEKTFTDNEIIGKYKKLGETEGESCQTKLLYVLPQSSPPDTTEAINNAKAQYKDTVFLADMTIDNNSKWHFLYSKDCIIARGTAYGNENSE